MTIISKTLEKSITLDIRDKKLLFLLNQNSRIPRKKLAHILRISPQLLHYKIEKLVTEQIIEQKKS